MQPSPAPDASSQAFHTASELDGKGAVHLLRAAPRPKSRATIRGRGRWRTPAWPPPRVADAPRRRGRWRSVAFRLPAGPLPAVDQRPVAKRHRVGGYWHQAHRRGRWRRPASIHRRRSEQPLSVQRGRPLPPVVSVRRQLGCSNPLGQVRTMRETVSLGLVLEGKGPRLPAARTRSANAEDGRGVFSAAAGRQRHYPHE